MYTVKDVTGRNGVTAGRRKNGSRAVLWSDGTVEWFSHDDFRRYVTTPDGFLVP